METWFTEHAQTRMRQRGITQATVNDLLAFGRTLHDHRGGMILYFDRLARAITRRNSRAYAVVAGDGAIVTVGHRYRRFVRR